RSDLGVARDRQQPDGEDAEQGDDDRDDRREHRAPDEEVADLLAALRRRRGSSRVHCRAPGPPGAADPAEADSVADAVSTAVTGRTRLPGAAFWAPSTTTRSPVASPFSMIQRLPLQGPGCTSRAVTV